MSGMLRGAFTMDETLSSLATSGGITSSNVFIS
jgi:hypothetical protein